jgi:OOP family OmpA-OmpF porin
VADLNRVLTQTKIAFAPGSAEIEAEGGRTLDKLAEILKRCLDIPMEIAGHTDSQGSESGNLALSQARAEAVLLGLQGRRVPVAALSAVGYGEGRPLQDNGSEEGREANRRIEFSLIAAPAGPAAEAAAPDGIAVPVNADPDAPGADRPRRRPESLAPRPTLPGFGRPQGARVTGTAPPVPEAEPASQPAPEPAPEPEPAPAAAGAEDAAGDAATAPAATPAETAPAGTDDSPAPAPAGASTATPDAVPGTPAQPAPALPAGGPVPPPDAATPRLAETAAATPEAAAAADPQSGPTAAADAATADEPFVSSAPTDPTLRPRGRPAAP